MEHGSQWTTNITSWLRVREPILSGSVRMRFGELRCHQPGHRPATRRTIEHWLVVCAALGVAIYRLWCFVGLWKTGADCRGPSQRTIRTILQGASGPCHSTDDSALLKCSMTSRTCDIAAQTRRPTARTLRGYTTRREGPIALRPPAGICGSDGTGRGPRKGNNQVRTRICTLGCLWRWSKR